MYNRGSIDLSADTPFTASWRVRPGIVTKRSSDDQRLGSVGDTGTTFVAEPSRVRNLRN